MAEQSLLFKRGLKAVLEAKLIGENKPKEGEPIFELDTNKLKIGDGVKNYADLPYISGTGGNQIIFDTYYQFPNVGEENKLYVAKDKNNSYIWNPIALRYDLISVDHNEIDGGGADSF